MSAIFADTSMTRKKATHKTVSILEHHLKKFLLTGYAQSAVPVKTLFQNNKKISKSQQVKRLCEFRKAFDAVYEKYNRKEFLAPDPLQFLYDYPETADRELIALIASSLAYGRVAQIIKSICNLCDRIGRKPFVFLTQNTEKDIRDALSGFKHRFTSGKELADVLLSAKFAIERYGSLQNAFAHFFSESDYISALDSFAKLLNGGREKSNYLIPRVSSGSACKRLNLMLKWLVRKDDIDPGGWTKIPASQLIIPLDTHMWQIALHLNFTTRKTPDFKAAIEITNAFKLINPDDPCKYDFALTRFGIRNTKKFRKTISL